MNSLKMALGKEDKQQKSISRTGYSNKHYNKSKSESMWALDPDVTGGGDNELQGSAMDRMEDSLESALKIAYAKDKIFSEIIFYDIVENIQVLLGEDVSELESLLAIEKGMKETLDRSKEETKNFNVSFYELLVKRIKKLKKKQKKDDLKEFDRIIHTNFRKKPTVQYINEDLNKQEYLEIKGSKAEKGLKHSGTYNSNDGSSSKKSNSSNQGKLKGLLKNSHDMFVKDESRGDKKNESVIEANESVSFSSVISQSMAVRQRAPRGGIKKEKSKQETMLDNQQKNQVNQDKDQAFIFYRPKKPKKGGQL